MKKLWPMFLLIAFTPLYFGFIFGKPKPVHVLEITESGEVIIDTVASLNTQFDIFKVQQVKAIDDPNKVSNVEVKVARIIIIRKTPTYSIGTIVNWLDGSKPKVADVSRGMICCKTTNETLKSEKKLYKYRKKALAREYALTKTNAKNKVYDSLGKSVKDVNDINSIKAGLIKVDKK